MTVDIDRLLELHSQRCEWDLSHKEEEEFQSIISEIKSQSKTLEYFNTGQIVNQKTIELIKKLESKIKQLSKEQKMLETYRKTIHDIEDYFVSCDSKNVDYGEMLDKIRYEIIYKLTT